MCILYYLYGREKKRLIQRQRSSHREIKETEAKACRGKLIKSWICRFTGEIHCTCVLKQPDRNEGLAKRMINRFWH